jgi:hypothetical protein
MYEGMIPQSVPIQIKDCVQPRQMVVMRGGLQHTSRQNEMFEITTVLFPIVTEVCEVLAGKI